MTEAGDDFPVVSADFDKVAFAHLTVGFWQDRTACFHGVATFVECGKADMVESMAPEEGEHGRDGVVAELVDMGECGEVFALRHPERSACLLFEPT